MATGAAGALSVAGPRSLELVPLVLFALALALFPSGRLPSTGWALLPAVALGAALAAGLVQDGALLALVTVAALAGRLGHPCELVRRQLLYVLLGGATALFAAYLDALYLPGAWAVGAVAIPVAIGVALLRRPLDDLDGALRHLLRHHRPDDLPRGWLRVRRVAGRDRGRRGRRAGAGARRRAAAPAAAARGRPARSTGAAAIHTRW